MGWAALQWDSNWFPKFQASPLHFQIQVASSTSMMSKNSMAASLTSTSILVLLLSSHVSSNPLPSNIFFPDTVKRFDIK